MKNCGFTKNEVKAFVEDALRHKKEPTLDDIIEAFCEVIIENNKRIEDYIKKNAAEIVSKDIVSNLRRRGIRL